MTRGRWMYATGIAVLTGVGVVGTLAGAFTASNTVPATNLLTQTDNPSLSTMAPTDCDVIVVTALVKGLGNLNGAATDDLILGGPAGQSLGGKGGDDCIVGGAGNDAITGNAGTDVCLGQGGTDTFASCEVMVQ